MADTQTKNTKKINIPACRKNRRKEKRKVRSEPQKQASKKIVLKAST